MSKSNNNMKPLKKLGHLAVSWAEDLGLVIVAIATVIAVGIEIGHMFKMGTVKLTDLLLLFIYLEILAMVAIYLDSGKLPVRMPLYIAMVALARYLILDMKNLDSWRMVGIAGSIVLISLAVLIHRYGHSRFPYGKEECRGNRESEE